MLVNAATERLFGYREAERFGKPVSILIPEHYRGAHERHIKNFASSDARNCSAGRFGQTVGRHADGRELPVDALISRMTRAGQP